MTFSKTVKLELQARSNEEAEEIFAQILKTTFMGGVNGFYPTASFRLKTLSGSSFSNPGAGFAHAEADRKFNPP